VSDQLSLSLNKNPGTSNESSDMPDTSHRDEQSLSQDVSEYQHIQEQFRGAFLGAAIGDALGFITEFMRSPNDIKRQFGTSKLTELQSWQRITNYSGKYKISLPLPAGTYSDDTQLTIATARSLQTDGTFDVESFAKLELPTWLHYQLGGGTGTKAAAKNLAKKSTSWNRNFYMLPYTRYTDSGGNGAAMRILPIALANASNPDLMYNNIWKNAITTHGHPRAIIGALLFADAIISLLKKPAGKKQWLNELTDKCDQKYPYLLEAWANCPEFSAWEKEWNQNTQKQFATVFRQACEQTARMLDMVQDTAIRLHQDIGNQPSIQVQRSVLSDLGCYTRSTKGAGNNTVVAAAFFFTVFSTYEEITTAIANEIYIDTDTIGYFAGAMYGIAYGIESIPQHFTEKIQDGMYLQSLADKCCHIYFGQTTHNGSFTYPELENNRKLQNFPGFSNGDSLEVGLSIDFPILGTGKITKDTNLTPRWTGKHVHFLEVHLELGQTIFLKISRSVPSSKHQYAHTNEKDVAYEGNQSASNLLSTLDGYKEKIERSNFTSDTILEVLRNIKFNLQNKALYDAFTTWLWGALPQNATQDEREIEHMNPSLEVSQEKQTEELASSSTAENQEKQTEKHTTSNADENQEEQEMQEKQEAVGNGRR
jgi:ADP-ribosylglycohydrolase